MDFSTFILLFLPLYLILHETGQGCKISSVRPLIENANRLKIFYGHKLLTPLPLNYKKTGGQYGSYHDNQNNDNVN